MKKFFVIFLALTLALGAGCSNQGEQPTTPVAVASAPTTEPAPADDQTEPTETTAPAAPRTVEGTVQGIHIPAILSFPQRGDIVQVTGYPDEATATVTGGNAQGSFAKVLLRFDSDESYEAWQAYAKYNTRVFEGYTLVGEPLATLKTNTQMTVLDDLGECYLVQTEDLTGYIAKTQASKWRIKGSSSSSGSGSGGSGTGKDGGDISLTGFAGDIRPVLLADTVKTGAAQVRADGGRVVLKYFDRGDKVQLVLDAEVAPEIPGYALILEDGVLAYIPVDWVEKPGDEAFQPWEGYAGYQCKCYDNFELAGKSLGQLSGNKKITVLWQSGDVLLVQSEADVSYIAVSTARTTPIPSSSGNSGSGSSGSSDGGSDGGSWTPPKL
mgnify:CR=1 FL=1